MRGGHKQFISEKDEKLKHTEEEKLKELVKEKSQK